MHAPLDEPATAFVVVDAEQQHGEVARGALDARTPRTDEQVRVHGTLRGGAQLGECTLLADGLGHHRLQTREGSE